MSVFSWVNIVLGALAAALFGALAWVTDWGQALTEPVALARKPVAKGDPGGLLPDFRLTAEPGTYAAISEKPLLNPTRRPAPPAPVAAATEPPKPQIRRGLYQLIGVTDLGAVKIAQVRELGNNRAHSVRVGDALQEMKVTAITGDSLTLSFAGETDVLSLAKFTASGRVPQPPAPPPLPVAAAPVAPPPAAPPPALPVSAVPAGSPLAAANQPPRIVNGTQNGSAAHEAEVRRVEAIAASNPTNWNRMRAESARRDFESARNAQQQQ